MAGNKLPITPRGLLLFHQMGSGKTIEALATALYCTFTNPIYTKNKNNKNKVIILNKSLVKKTFIDLEKYINKLNRFKLGLDLLPTNKPINYQEIANEFTVIVMNDPVHFTDNFEQLFEITGLVNKFIIFDEAHNLFRGINNLNKKSIQIYDHIMSKSNMQILFLTGSAVGSHPRELAFCFQMLSANQNLFSVLIQEKGNYYDVSTDFDEFFIEKTSQENEVIIKNKEIFIKRIAGLCSFVQMDLSTSGKSAMPNLFPIQYVNVMIKSRDQLLAYDSAKQDEKSRLGKRTDQFMQKSRMCLDGIVHDFKIYSTKFEIIKKNIENNYGFVQIVYSNFIPGGIQLFAQFCQQFHEDYEWVEFNPLTPKDTSKKQIIYCQIHGGIEVTEREQMLQRLINDDNSRGKFIDVVLLGPAGAEGINIRHARFVHIMEPQWSQSIVEQVIYRAVRQGSHSTFEEKFKNVTPLMYIGCIQVEIDLEDKQMIREFKDRLSTDQIIQLKSVKTYNIIKEFNILLQLASINCSDFADVIIKGIKDRLNKAQLQQPCFKCESNSKQLFDPKNITNDLQNHNCIVNTAKAFQQSQFTESRIVINNIAYGWFLDIYANMGIRIIEIRNSRYVQENTPLYYQIIQEINQQKLIQNNQQKQPQNEENKQEITVEIVSKHNIQGLIKSPEVIDFTQKNVFTPLLPSKLNVDVQPGNEVLHNCQFYKAVSMLEMDMSIENTIKKIKMTQIDSLQQNNIYFQPVEFSTFVHKNQIILRKNAFEELLLPIYIENVYSQKSILLQKLKSFINNKKNIILVTSQNCNSLDMKLFKQLILSL